MILNKRMYTFYDTVAPTEVAKELDQKVWTVDITTSIRT
jgi:hypothetical protein